MRTISNRPSSCRIRLCSPWRIQNHGKVSWADVLIWKIQNNKSNTGERFFKLQPYTVWKEFKEQYEGAYEEEYDEEDWDNSADEWESFEKTILCQTYREEFGDFDAYEEWQRRTNRGIQQDIGLFTGLEALRLFSAEYQDMTFLRAMHLLRVLEVVESRFVSLEGIDDLMRLKQLCCWFY